MRGRIHSLERMGTVDGPGVRFVVFFQGCPLQCRFCHNRDTWDATCGEEWEAEDLKEEILRYRSFFGNHGGVTFSGGEPLLQAEFAAELAELLQAEGVHVALDTSGYAPLTEAVRRLLRAVDLVLLDIKHPEEEGHQWLTGVSRGLPVAFGTWLKETDKELWVRYVLVPGINDAPELLKKTGRTAAGFGRVTRVEVLPYHRMGVSKWEAMGLEDPLPGIREATPEEAEQACQMIKTAMGGHG